MRISERPRVHSARWRSHLESFGSTPQNRISISCRMATFKFDDIATDDDIAVDFNLAKNQLHYQIR